MSTYEKRAARAKRRLEDMLARNARRAGVELSEGVAAMELMKMAEVFGLLPDWCPFSCTGCADVLRCTIDGQSNIECLEAPKPGMGQAPACHRAAASMAAEAPGVSRH